MEGEGWRGRGKDRGGIEGRQREREGWRGGRGERCGGEGEELEGGRTDTVHVVKLFLVLGDYFTIWVESYPIPNMEAKTIANVFVSHFVNRFGAPDVLHTDQGRNFESALFKEVCLLLGVQKTRTTPYHPQSDGLVERTLLDLLSIASREDERNWDLCIPAVMLAYRTSVQESTGCTPYFLLFGRA